MIASTSSSSSLSGRSPRGRLRVASGFSFIELLVVMGIIAVLAGIGVSVYIIAFKKTPEIKTKALLQKIRGSIDLWHAQYGAYPSTDLQMLGTMAGLPMKIGKTTNTTNGGIESVYQALLLPGFSHHPELGSTELTNTDDDKLDKALAPSGDADLWEIRDAWGNPLVYIADRDYATMEKSPIGYICGASNDPDSREAGDGVEPKPWRLPSGDFAQRTLYQLYSMGPDGKPNTEDDIKAWE